MRVRSNISKSLEGRRQCDPPSCAAAFISARNSSFCRFEAVAQVGEGCVHVVGGNLASRRRRGGRSAAAAASALTRRRCLRSRLRPRLCPRRLRARGGAGARSAGRRSADGRARRYRAHAAAPSVAAAAADARYALRGAARAPRSRRHRRTCRRASLPPAARTPSSTSRRLAVIVLLVGRRLLRHAASPRHGMPADEDHRRAPWSPPECAPRGLYGGSSYTSAVGAASADEPRRPRAACRKYFSGATAAATTAAMDGSRARQSSSGVCGAAQLCGDRQCGTASSTPPLRRPSSRRGGGPVASPRAMRDASNYDSLWSPALHRRTPLRDERLARRAPWRLVRWLERGRRRRQARLSHTSHRAARRSRRAAPAGGHLQQRARSYASRSCGTLPASRRAPTPSGTTPPGAAAATPVLRPSPPPPGAAGQHRHLRRDHLPRRSTSRVPPGTSADGPGGLPSALPPPIGAAATDEDRRHRRLGTRGGDRWWRSVDATADLDEVTPARCTIAGGYRAAAVEDYHLRLGGEAANRPIRHGRVAADAAGLAVMQRVDVALALRQHRRAAAAIGSGNFGWRARSRLGHDRGRQRHRSRWFSPEPLALAAPRRGSPLRLALWVHRGCSGSRGETRYVFGRCRPAA